jgi:5-formyltetrahydrofolate cyclo-ligase
LSDPVPIQDAKRALRQRMKLLRSGERDDPALIAGIFSVVAFHTGETVAGVWPLPGEPDLRPLWHGLHARGHRLLLPEVTAVGEPLRFRHWRPGCPMLPGRFGTQHPDFGTVAADAVPETIFVPLLAFDLAGYRLGHGGGYYDRTLAALPLARAIGYGFGFQQVEAVPRGPFDRPLSMIVTEVGRVPIER